MIREGDLGLWEEVTSREIIVLFMSFSSGSSLTTLLAQ